MNFIRDICNALINLFISNQRQEIPKPLIDVSKVCAEEFEDMPELPKEFIAEPFYSTMLSDLVEAPLCVPAQLPMVGEPLEPLQLVCRAMDTNIPHSDEDTV